MVGFSLNRARLLELLVGIFAMVLANSCGVGSAGLFAASQSDDPNARPTLTGLAVSSGKAAPAMVSFDLLDVEGDTTSIEELRVHHQQLGGGARVSPAHLYRDRNMTVSASLNDLSPGENKQLFWDFVSQFASTAAFGGSPSAYRKHSGS